MSKKKKTPTIYDIMNGNIGPQPRRSEYPIYPKGFHVIDKTTRETISNERRMYYVSEKGELYYRNHNTGLMDKYDQGEIVWEY